MTNKLSTILDLQEKEFEKKWSYASFTWNGDNITGIKMAKQVRRNIKSFLTSSHKQVLEGVLAWAEENVYQGNNEMVIGFSDLQQFIQEAINLK